MNILRIDYWENRNVKNNNFLCKKLKMIAIREMAVVRVDTAYIKIHFLNINTFSIYLF